MLWKLLGKFTPNLRNGGDLFGSLKSPLFTSHHFQCTVRLNQTAEKWIKTLAEDKQKRVRHIQNEVSIRQISANFLLFLYKMNFLCNFAFHRLLFELLKERKFQN